MALITANYKFIYIDVGGSSRAGDAGIYTDSDLKRALGVNSINLPPPESDDGIPGHKVYYHIVGDNAFSLSMNMMKPYPHRNLDKPKRIFNYRFSRARRVVENAFGMFANRFCVSLTTINLSPEKVQHLILVACYLHNFFIENNE